MQAFNFTLIILFLSIYPSSSSDLFRKFGRVCQNNWCNAAKDEGLDGDDVRNTQILWNQWSPTPLVWGTCQDFLDYVVPTCDKTNVNHLGVNVTVNFNGVVPSFFGQDYSKHKNETDFLTLFQFLSLASKKDCSIKEFFFNNQTKYVEGRKLLYQKFIDLFTNTRSGKFLQNIFRQNDTEFKCYMKSLWFYQDDITKSAYWNSFISMSHKNTGNSTCSNWILLKTTFNQIEMSSVNILEETLNPLICQIEYSSKNGIQLTGSNFLAGKDPSYTIAINTWCFKYYPGKECNVLFDGQNMGRIKTEKTKDGRFKSAYFMQEDENFQECETP